MSRKPLLDRHDAISLTGITLVAVGIGAEFGLAWAAIAVGVVCLAVAWKGLR